MRWPSVLFQVPSGKAPGLPPVQPRPHSPLPITPLFLRAASSQCRPVPALSGTPPCWLSGVGSLLPFLLVFWPLLLPCLWLPLCLQYHFVASSFLVFSLSGSSFSKMVFFSPSPQDSLSSRDPPRLCAQFSILLSLVLSLPSSVSLAFTLFTTEK